MSYLYKLGMLCSAKSFESTLIKFVVRAPRYHALVWFQRPGSVKYWGTLITDIGFFFHNENVMV